MSSLPLFKPIKPLIITLVLLSVFLGATEVCHALQQADYDQALKVFRGSPKTKNFFDNAYGYAIFPMIGKGGVGLGASFGKGQVYRQRKLTGYVHLAKLSLGFQLGGQAFSELIFFQDKRAYNEFISGSFEFDATASVVAITAGAQAKTGTIGSTAGTSTGPASGKQAGAKYNKGMATFVHTKGGLMYEASIGGQSFSFEPLGKSKN